MGPRWHRLLSEAGKFMAVGGVATLVAFLLFNFLVHGFWTRFGGIMDDQPIAAYVLANLVGMVISYRGTRSWAFQHRKPVHPDGGRTAFLLINLATMAIPTACLWFSRHVLGLTDPLSDNISANVIGATLGTITRFYLYRTWVFRHPKTPGLPATVLERLDERVDD
jgi:putative flippase GtrA